MKIVLIVSYALLRPQMGIAGDAEDAFDKGTDLLRQGAVDAAIVAFTDAISQKNDYAEAYNNRGLSYFEKNDFVHAKSDFLNAITYSPADEKAHNNLAIVYYEEGDDAKP